MQENHLRKVIIADNGLLNLYLVVTIVPESNASPVRDAHYNELIHGIDAYLSYSDAYVEKNIVAEQIEYADLAPSQRMAIDGAIRQWDHQRREAMKALNFDLERMGVPTPDLQYHAQVWDAVFQRLTR